MDQRVTAIFLLLHQNAGCSCSLPVAINQRKLTPPAHNTDVTDTDPSAWLQWFA